VPLTEFQRLQDQVHTILLRLDRIDDALREIRDGMGGVAAKGTKGKKKG
jgi:chaperonin cofactor prefoldin